MAKSALLAAGPNGETHTDWWSAGGTTERESLGHRVDEGDTPGVEPRLAAMYETAAMPGDDFVYGPPESRVDFYVPPPGPYAGTAVSLRSALQFINETRECLTRDEATGYIEAILDLLESPEASDRVVLAEDEPENWRSPDSHMPELLRALWKLYGVDWSKDMIRDDGADVYGTKIWLASSGARTFLLVIRSEFREAPDGEPTIIRMLEAVKVSSNDDVWEEALRHPPAEVLRVEELLDRYQATQEEQEYVRYYANRYTVRRDADVWGLILRRRRQSRTGLSAEAQYALRYVIGPQMARAWAAVTGRD